MAKIRDVIIKKDAMGDYKEIRIVFGPHYFIELLEQNEKITFRLGATHHGLQADASEVNGELEQLIYEIREKYPNKCID